MGGGGGGGADEADDLVDGWIGAEDGEDVGAEGAGGASEDLRKRSLAFSFADDIFGESVSKV
ncbi:MAG: hypothetical protein LQ347_005245 [Umbilicaria vellea]|nr:MAG: hypothetical protein LQ347_005245 [Umbilicaria vellea]